MTDHPMDSAVERPEPAPDEQRGDDLLTRALGRARRTIFWERLWPVLASLATVAGLFLASLGLASGCGCRRSGAPSGSAHFSCSPPRPSRRFSCCVPSRYDGLKRLDRNSGLPHRPATAAADELAASTSDTFSLALWHVHVERALRAARTLKAGHARAARCKARSLCAARRWWRCWWSRRSSPPAASG